MRLFIAITLDDVMKSALQQMQASLRAQRVGGSYAPAENLHLTLAFIGEYGDPERVLEVMRTVPFTPFDITLEGFGCFGDLYWCGLGAQPALDALVRRLRHSLAEAGIPFDRKRFSPHITLLRRARYASLPTADAPGASMKVTGISLMRSERGSGGMIYTEMGSAGISGED